MPRQILPKSSWIAPDFVPETFGRLTTTSSRYKPEDSKCVVQDFVCECGKQVTLWPYNVTRGGTQSCGCLRRERYAEWAASLPPRTSNTPTWISWHAMRERCRRQNNKCFDLYGGRGIKVHPEFDTYESFLSHMGPRPSLQHSLDRIDPEGDYAPGNCRWATATEQARNTRFNRRITYNGETRCIAEWAEILGVGAPMLYQRLNAGWPVEDAFRTPAGEAHRLSHVYRRRVESRKSKHYTYNGLTMTLYEWALHLGIAKVTLKARLAKGWPISRVLGEPVKKKKSSH